jgi:hypothetical protein
MRLFLCLFVFLAHPVFSEEPRQDVRVKQAAVNVRQNAATSSAVLFTAKAGDTFRLVGTEGDWVQIETPDGKRGFIFKTLVELIPIRAAAAAGAAPGAPQPQASANPAPAPQGAPSIDHTPLDCILAEHFPILNAAFGGEVARARVYFRAGGTLHWYYVDMALEKDRYTGILPKPKKETQKIDYYVDGLAKDSAEGRTKDYAPAVVSSKSECEKKMMAATASAAKIVVGAEPGAPAIPEGFDPAGIVQAAVAGVATVAAVGSHTTALLIGGGAVLVGGVALAAKGGGGMPTPPPCVPSGIVFSINYGFTGSVSCSATNTVDQTYSVTNNTCAPVTVQGLTLGVSFSGSSQCVNNPGNVAGTGPLTLNGTTTIPAGQTVVIRTSPVAAGQARTFCCSGGGGACNGFSLCTVNEVFTLTTSAGKSTLNNSIAVSGGSCPACSLPHADANAPALFYSGSEAH